MSDRTPRSMVQRHLEKDWAAVSARIRPVAEERTHEQLVEWAVRAQTGKDRLSERMAVIANLVTRIYHGRDGLRASDQKTLDMLVGLATAGEVLNKEHVAAIGNDND